MINWCNSQYWRQGRLLPTSATQPIIYWRRDRFKGLKEEWCDQGWLRVNLQCPWCVKSWLAPECCSKKEEVFREAPCIQHHNIFLPIQCNRRQKHNEKRHGMRIYSVTTWVNSFSRKQKSRSVNPQVYDTNTMWCCFFGWYYL